MPEFRVSWEIDIDADEGLSPAFRTAAIEANNRGAESPYLDDEDDFALGDEPDEPEDTDDRFFAERIMDDPEDED